MIVELTVWIGVEVVVIVFELGVVVVMIGGVVVGGCVDKF